MTNTKHTPLGILTPSNESRETAFRSDLALFIAEGSAGMPPTVTCDTLAWYVWTTEAERDALQATNAQLLTSLKRAAPWLGKLIADDAHLNSVAPGDAIRTLEMVEAAIAKAEGGAK